MARPRKASPTTTKRSPLRATKSESPPKGRASPRKATPSAKVAESAADTVHTGRVTKAATKRAASPAKRAASPAKRDASPAKRPASPAKARKAPNPALLRLARSASPAKGLAKAKSVSPGPQFTGEGRTESYTNWDLEQFEPAARRATEEIDGAFPPLKAAWALLRKNAFLDGRAKQGETSAAITARSLYRALKKEVKKDMGPEFDDAWKLGITAAKLGRYLQDTGEELLETAVTPTVTPPRGRPVGPRSPKGKQPQPKPKSPAKGTKVKDGRVTKSKSPSKGSPSKAPASPTKTQPQSPLEKKVDSGVVVTDNSKDPKPVRPQSPGKSTTTKTKVKPTASPARPYQDNRGCDPTTRGSVISCTNLEWISDIEGKPNPFFETLPTPEVWHRRMPPYFPFGETPLMEAWVSHQIDEDLKRGVTHDEEIQNKHRSVVGKVLNAGQKAASSMMSMVWRRPEDRRYPPAWALPEVDEDEIAEFTMVVDSKAAASTKKKGCVKPNQ